MQRAKIPGCNSERSKADSNPDSLLTSVVRNVASVVLSPLWLVGTVVLSPLWLVGLMPGAPPTNKQLCQLDGCNAEAFVHKSTKTVHDFCSRTHAREAASIGQTPRRDSWITNIIYQINRMLMALWDTFNSRVTLLLNKDPSYGAIHDQFIFKWQKGANKLRVERIFEVKVSKWLRRKYVNYERGKSNTRRRFHGTSCSSECNFFFDLEGAPCKRRDCSVCNICRKGFMLKDNTGRTARASNFKLRYGNGLYSSSVSGKANDYAAQSEKSRNGKKWRCMFAVTVTVGRAYITQEGELPENMCPPQGYDAVVGEVGTSLNYDEVVVYNEAAAVPTHLIVYSTA